ncbi:MAG: DnaB-like helicase N-terminal domain-containing protein, partial [Albidovulum sp.]
MTEIATLRVAPSAAAEAEALPHNIEAEQQLLGVILTNNDVYDRISSLVRAEHFYDPVHSRIFEIAAARIQKNALASPVTLKAFVEDDPGLKELGGPSYLARLAGAAISAFAARDYAQMIYDLAVRRELMALGRDIAARAAKVDVESEPREQIIEAEQRLYKLAEQGASERGFQSFLKAVTDAVNMANAAYQRDGGLAGISTGLIDLDKKLGGLHPSDLLILAGRPSMGKTSLATNIAFNIAKAFRSEQQLLGAIMVNNDVYDRITSVVKSEHFFDPVHQRIFEIAAARIQKNALASPVTLKAFMEDDQGLKELGGPAYLVRLAGSAISSFAARDYAQMIYDLAVRRELIQLGRDISDRAAKVDVESEPREQIIEAE